MLFADLAWSTLSPDIRAEISQTMIRTPFRRLRDAFHDDTFDAKRTGTSVSRPCRTDWAGWEDIATLMAGKDVQGERHRAGIRKPNGRRTNGSDYGDPPQLRVSAMYEKAPEANSVGGSNQLVKLRSSPSVIPPTELALGAFSYMRGDS